MQQRLGGPKADLLGQPRPVEALHDQHRGVVPEQGVVHVPAHAVRHRACLLLHRGGVDGDQRQTRVQDALRRVVGQPGHVVIAVAIVAEGRVGVARHHRAEAGEQHQRLVAPQLLHRRQHRGADLLAVDHAVALVGPGQPGVAGQVHHPRQAGPVRDAVRPVQHGGEVLAVLVEVVGHIQMGGAVRRHGAKRAAVHLLPELPAHVEPLALLPRNHGPGAHRRRRRIAEVIAHAQVESNQRTGHDILEGDPGRGCGQSRLYWRQQGGRARVSTQASSIRAAS